MCTISVKKDLYCPLGDVMCCSGDCVHVSRKEACNSIAAYKGEFKLDGTCPVSLRQCITAANSDENIKAIEFDVDHPKGESIHVDLEGPLPSLKASVTIDGGIDGTQVNGHLLTPANGTSCNETKLECSVCLDDVADQSNCCKDGLTVSASSTIKNMVFKSFGRNGIVIAASNVEIFGGGAVSNCGHGIWALSVVANITITPSDDLNAPIALSNNGRDGLNSNATKTVISGVRALSNGGNGIYFGSNAQGSGVSADNTQGLSVLGLNSNSGITSEAPSTTIVGTLVGLWGDGISLVGNSGNGIVLTASAKGSRIGGSNALRVIVVDNKGTGIAINAPNALVLNTRVGLGPKDQAFGNHGTAAGILIGTSATGTSIGVPLTANANYVGANAGVGIVVLGDNVRIFNTHIGIGSENQAVGNMKDGIHVFPTAMSCRIGGLWNNNAWTVPTDYITTSIGNNKHNGILTAGPSTLIRGVAVGMAIDGKTVMANTQNGIFLDTTAVFSGVGSPIRPGSNENISKTTIISGNGQDGLFCKASNLTIVSGYYGIGWDGTIAGNGGNGISLGGHADYARIGARRSANNLPALPGPVVVGGNTGYGIRSAGEQTSISNVLVGLNADRITRAANGLAGIRFEAAALTPVIGDKSDLAPSYRTVIAGNGENGLEIGAPSATINNVYIGLTGNGGIGRNGGHGIELNETATDATIGGRWPSSSTVISCNVKHGIYSVASELSVSMVLVGTDRLGDSTTYGNGGDGIRIGSGARKVLIGLHLKGTDTVQSMFGNVSDLTATTLISGNKGNGIFSNAEGTSVVATRIGTDIYGRKRIGNAASGINFGSDASDAVVGRGHLTFKLVIVSANNVNGITSGASNTIISNSIIGLSSEQTPLGNGGDGIALSASAAGSDIGVIGNAPVIVGSNKDNGIYTNAAGTQVINALVGINMFDARVGNLKHGVRFDTYAQNSRFGLGAHTYSRANSVKYSDTISSGNAGYGVIVYAEEVTISHCVIGASGAGDAAGNNFGGVYFDRTALNAVVGGPNTTTTVISGNNADGLATEAPSIDIVNVIIGLNADLKRTANKGNGITIASTASHALIGVNTTAHNTIISGNEGYGILVQGRNAVIVRAGVGAVRESQSAEPDVEGNDLDGIRIEETGVNTLVYLCHVYGNNQSGISTSAGGVRLVENKVGDLIDSGAKSLGNLGYGIVVRDNTENVVILRNEIGSNGLMGLGVDRAGYLANFEKQNTLDKGNVGFRAKACVLCTCETDWAGLKALDCTKSQQAINGGFGDLFPQDIPNDIAVIRMSGIALSQVDWNQLQSISSLRSLDLSNNPNLDAIPPSGLFAEGEWSLSTLSLSGTDLHRLQTDSFTGIQSRLEYLDISSPSVAPTENVVLSLGKFQELKIANLFSVECPPGYYASTSLTLVEDELSCLRCPDDTYKPTTGGLINECLPCPEGKSNAGDASTTSCTGKSNPSGSSGSCDDYSMSPATAAGITAAAFFIITLVCIMGFVYFKGGTEIPKLTNDKYERHEYMKGASSNLNPAPLLQPKAGNFHLSGSSAKSGQKVFETNTDMIPLKIQRHSVSPVDSDFEEAGGYLEVNQSLDDEDGEC